MTDHKMPQEGSQKWALGIYHFLFLPPLFAFLLFPPSSVTKLETDMLFIKHWALK